MFSESGSDDSDYRTHGPNVGVIVGATIGGMVFVAISVLDFLFIRRRRSRNGGMISDGDRSSLQGAYETTMTTSTLYTAPSYNPGTRPLFIDALTVLVNLNVPLRVSSSVHFIGNRGSFTLYCHIRLEPHLTIPAQPSQIQSQILCIAISKGGLCYGCTARLY